MVNIAHFDIKRVEYLDSESHAHNLPKCGEDKSLLLDLYKQMVRVRMFDKKAIALQRTGLMGTYAPLNGQEAISTAIGRAMRSDDVFVPYYRDYAAQFQRGVTMLDILSYWGGDERGSNFNNPHDLPICVPIASQCLHATGVAFAFQYRNEPKVAVVCIGDGGTSEGDFYEALNVAGAWNLPVVFVVNNNKWAISVPLSEQTACETIAQKAIAAGFEGIQVDGNDVIACYEQIYDAIEKARQGNGPTLIEATTYRLCDHTTADDASRYQPPNEVKEATKIEPIARLQKYLMQQSWWSEAEQQDLEQTCQKEIDETVEAYANREPQPITSIFDHMYESLPEPLIEQRAIAIEEMENA